MGCLFDIPTSFLLYFVSCSFFLTCVSLVRLSSIWFVICWLSIVFCCRFLAEDWPNSTCGDAGLDFGHKMRTWIKEWKATAVVHLGTVCLWFASKNMELQKISKPQLGFAFQPEKNNSKPMPSRLDSNWAEGVSPGPILLKNPSGFWKEAQLSKNYIRKPIYPRANLSRLVIAILLA